MMMKMTTTVTSFKEQEECSVQRQRSCPQRECGLTRRLLSENLEKSSPRSSPKREAVVTTTEQVRSSSKIRSQMQSNKLWLVTLLLAGTMLSVDAAGRRRKDYSPRCLVTDEVITGYGLENGRDNQPDFWLQYEKEENEAYLNSYRCMKKGHDKLWELIIVEITDEVDANFTEKCIEWKEPHAIKASLHAVGTTIVENFEVDSTTTYYLNNCSENQRSGKKYVVFSLLEMKNGNETPKYLNLYNQLYKNREVLKSMRGDVCLSEQYSDGIPMELTLENSENPIKCTLIREITSTQECNDEYHYTPNRELQVLQQQIIENIESRCGHDMLKKYKQELLKLNGSEPTKELSKFEELVRSITTIKRVVKAFKDLKNARTNASLPVPPMEVQPAYSTQAAVERYITKGLEHYESESETETDPEEEEMLILRAALRRLEEKKQKREAEKAEEAKRLEQKTAKISHEKYTEMAEPFN